jgi:hypothetical protein
MPSLSRTALPSRRAVKRCAAHSSLLVWRFSPILVQMQLCYAQRQLLLRCSLRCYSAGAVSGNSGSDAVVASGTSASRLRRPLASSFGGISIRTGRSHLSNISGFLSASRKCRGASSKQNKQIVCAVHLHNLRFFLNPSFLARPDDSNNKSLGTRRTGQQKRYDGVGKSGTSAMSGWDDGLVSLSFSSRLKQHQKKQTPRDTRPEAQPRKQHSKPVHVRRHGQKEQGVGFQATRRVPAEKPPAATQESRAGRAAKSNPRAPSMTKSSVSSFKVHAQSKPTPSAASTRETIPDAVATRTTTTTTTTGPSADRNINNARLTALSSTNLSALFRTRDNPIAGIPLPTHASTTARVRSVLEHSAGDYSRFLPRRVGVRKSTSRLSALRTARHALAAQRDISLGQRRIALHIIGGLMQPHPQARK